MAKTFHTNNLHVHFFTHDHLGFTIKYRKGSAWTWHQFYFWKRNTNKRARRIRDKTLRKKGEIILTRPTVTAFEYAKWHTSEGANRWEHKRIQSAKAYIRLKVCVGGRVVQRERGPTPIQGSAEPQSPNERQLI